MIMINMIFMCDHIWKVITPEIDKLFILKTFMFLDNVLVIFFLQEYFPFFRIFYTFKVINGILLYIYRR